MSLLMLQAELAQLRKQFQALMLEREQYVRLTACLANLIRLKADAKLVNGNVAVDLADYMAVPAKWQIALEQRNVKPADAPEDAKGEDVVVVVVAAKVEPPKLALVGPPQNGHSRILLP